MTTAPPQPDCPQRDCGHPLYCHYNGCAAVDGLVPASVAGPTRPVVEDYAAIAARLKELQASRKNPQ